MFYSFVTLERNGLLFYNGRLNHQHDFMALELVDGQVQLNFSTGGSWTHIDLYVDGGVNDGRWHTVELQYYNQVRVIVYPTNVIIRHICDVRNRIYSVFLGNIQVDLNGHLFILLLIYPISMSKFFLAFYVFNT